MTTRKRPAPSPTPCLSATGSGTLPRSLLKATRPVFPRPPKPSRICDQKLAYQMDLAQMGILTDEPLRHTRHSAALRYLDIRDEMAGNCAVLDELPFADHGGIGSGVGSNERDAEMEEVVRPANHNEIVGPGSKHAPVEEGGERVLYMQTREESRRMRRVRNPGRRERDRFRRLIKGDATRQWDREETGVDLTTLF